MFVHLKVAQMQQFAVELRQMACFGDGKLPSLHGDQQWQPKTENFMVVLGER